MSENVENVNRLIRRFNKLSKPEEFTDATIKSWSKALTVLLRNHHAKEIQETIDFAFTSEFWKPILVSKPDTMAYFVEKYDTLVGQQKADKAKSEKATNPAAAARQKLAYNDPKYACQFQRDPKAWRSWSPENDYLAIRESK